MKRQLLNIMSITSLLALSLLTTAGNVGAATTIDCKGAKNGDSITMIYQWSGQEEAKLNTILKPLIDACGLNIVATSSRDQSLLDTLVKGGNPPDIFFPTGIQIDQYADKEIPMDTLGATKDNYADFFLKNGIVRGKWLGLPVKSDIKTIVWYDPKVFKSKGYKVPTTWDQLNILVETMVKNKDIPWSTGLESGPATGWTGADFIEDILLVQQSPDFVNNIIGGKVPYNDPGVKAAYQTYAKWASDPKYTVGGAQGTVSTNFNAAILKVFSDPPAAMMVKQSGFASGTITAKYPTLKYSVDFDFFGVPGAKGLQGGNDVMAAFKDSPAVRALVAYISSSTGGAAWAAANFDLSPNKGAAGHYTDPAQSKKGDILAKATGFAPSVGDAIGGSFSAAQWQAIVNIVQGRDIDAELAIAAKAQAETLGVAAVSPNATMAATAAK